MQSENLVVNGKMSPDLKTRLSEALRLRTAKKYAESKEILLALSKENSASAFVFGILGDIYWHLGRLRDAVACFARATHLSPESELASLGLFHTLWESGKTRRALKEMERFLSLSRSREHAKLLRELIPVSSHSDADHTSTCPKKNQMRKPDWHSDSQGSCERFDFLSNAS